MEKWIITGAEKLDSKGYDRSCREYDESSIKDSEKKIDIS